MKSSPHALGNLNMHGKKEATLSCGCCTAFDLRGKEAARLASQEIRAATCGQIETLNTSTED